MLQIGTALLSMFPSLVIQGTPKVHQQRYGEDVYIRAWALECPDGFARLAHHPDLECGLHHYDDECLCSVAQPEEIDILPTRMSMSWGMKVSKLAGLHTKEAVWCVRASTKTAERDSILAT